MTIEPITPLNEMKISPEPNSGCWLWLGDININGLTPRLNAERGKIITHCPHGHEYTSENTYIRENPKGWASRKCRTCARLRELERYAKLKAQDDFGRRRERKVPRYRDPEEWR